MRTIQTNVYTYDELSDEAKEKARDWYRQCDAGDNYFAETPVNEFLEIGAALGFTFAPANPNRQPRKPRDAVYYEGFSHQGSGASFDASWAARDLSADKVRAIMADRPATYTDANGKTQTSHTNADLQPILAGFLDLVTAEPESSASVRASHRYQSLAVEYYPSDLPNDESDRENMAAREDTFKSLCEDFASWLYRVLETEYEYQNSDEYVAETIIANDYEFTADGERA